ncbi:P-loop containing nucleoside triphosphate hydrolase protein, partial [Rozella allomycis CSF55]
GKTESVKALGCLLGRQVMVFNCDEGLDVESMERIFTGIVKCGSWVCFDEFNRLDSVVLAAVSQQIQEIQSVLVSSSEGDVLLMNNRVPVHPNSAIFVTLNPVGRAYKGRQKIPFNLKVLFRPIAMSVPDKLEISETLLFANGFMQSKLENNVELAESVCRLFDYCMKLVGRRKHYDWSLRSLKPVLESAGN